MISLLRKVGIAGSGPAMQQVASVIAQVAATDLSVLVTGESGTGKELVARAIHENSRRAEGPLITVNCGAIPEGIFESEVFGHEKGAFTGADRQRKGMFELANGGTIFLDEIGEMPLFSQVKILRVLETGEFMRVGGQVPLNVNVRVVAATNRDLATEVQQGSFRQDLYFRLKAINIVLPPLRDRPEDIPDIVRHVITHFCQSNRMAEPQLRPEALERLQGHYWQGNVRELKNFVESLLIFSGGGAIDARLVDERLAQDGSSALLPVLRPMESQSEGSAMTPELLRQMFYFIQHELAEIKTLLSEQQEAQRLSRQELDLTQMTVEELERDHIREVLADHGGNRNLAARSLGISERTLYRKIRRYGL
ncbi:MAG: sigma-54-dependent Fis family transcriptional regulator [Calditrichaeota bacterium]|nr:sigma-54-dependent Fis family transcriptional regulator [Candidatus Cloacimonadota bacterium]MCB1046398.1 sigma-54-dependent Fis family transcriptional regulator [Calditrichota bacterium]MCB9474805.1 sigma-54-dependent Fis family transcriptional regulator [Candidatus Delongbacteria bacterium]